MGVRVYQGLEVRLQDLELQDDHALSVSSFHGKGPYGNDLELHVMLRVLMVTISKF